MLYNEYISIKNIVIHKVNNKSQDEGITFSKKELSLNKDVKTLLTSYFIQPFKSTEYYTLFHDSDLKYNEVFGFVTDIFANSSSLYEQSIRLAKHLYEKSTHPQIKGGEFYTVYFKDCIINGETVDAIGLFKSENKDTFLKIYASDNGFEIGSEEGININKLDKGCLIFNTELENGYIVAIVDNTNKKIEAKYWVDDFLHARRREDKYFNTQNILSLCKNFITKELPQQFDISKAEQAELLNKSVNFFKENENFNITEFEQKVIGEKDIINNFKEFKRVFQGERDINISDSFTISDSVVKKQSKTFKSIIKLDKNFQIYIHGEDNQLIKKGFDKEKGMSYYQLYFEEEQ